MKRLSLVVACLIVGVLAGAFVAGPFLLGQGASGADRGPVVTGIPKELASYRDVVKKVLPAVVSIEARAKVIKAAKPQQKRRTPFDDSQVPEEFRRFFEMPFGDDDNSPPTPHGGFGSGFLVDPKGVVLTNNHVVDGADQVTVELRDGRKFVSKDIKTDPKTDLAIVRIDVKGTLPYLALGDSDAMEIGDRVLAVGAPFGLTGTVTHGIVSAKARSLHMNMYEDFVQTDAPINPGNSGGPLVNLEGQVIGINAAIKSRSGGFQGIGLAVSSNIARNVMDQLLKNGVVHRGYLGVQIKDVLDPEVASRLGLKEGESGVLVTRVFNKTPGAKAGFKDGDVIERLAGKPIKDGHELQTVVASLPLGQPVEVAVLRDGKLVNLSVTIEEQPREYGTARVTAPQAPQGQRESVSVDKFGVEVADLTPELADQLGYPEQTSGAVITKVDPNGLAAESGLRRGMVIRKIDKKSVASAKGLEEAAAKASLEKGVLLQVQTPQGGTNFVLLRSGAGASK
jgi:serine protease Do